MLKNSNMSVIEPRTAEYYYIGFSLYGINYDIGSLIYFSSKEDFINKTSSDYVSIILRDPVEGTHLPESAQNMIYDALMENPYLRNAQYPSHYFSASQKEALTRKLEERTRAHWAREERIAKKDAHDLIYWRLGALALGAVSIMLLAKPLWLAALVGGWMGYQAKLIKSVYDTYAKMYFQTDRELKSCSYQERDVLQAGIEAGQSWRGYLNSYKNFATYRHPITFATGKRFVTDEKQPAIDTLMKLR